MEQARDESPIGEFQDILEGLLRRLRLPYLLRHYDSLTVLSLFTLVNGFLSISLMALAAFITRAPFVFPSLGPTAFLCFYRPSLRAASPRNALFGHLIGALVGWSALLIFGLQNHSPVLQSGLTWPAILAAGMSLGFTSALMVFLRTPHPPACATTLIVSLGILSHFWQLGVLMAAVVLLTLQATAINKVAGVRYPLWQ